MRKIITGIFVIMLFAVTSQAVYAKAVGEFVKVEGRVDITRPGTPAEPANVGTEIFEKDIIRSKSDSKAEILFTDGNVLRLAQKTRVEISEYISDSNGRSTILNLFRGKIQNKVKKMLGGVFGDDNNRYEVHTPTSVCGVRGTDFFMSYQKGVSGATFKEGFGYAYNVNQPGNVIDIQAGQSMIIPDANTLPMVRTAAQDEIDRLEEETTPVEEDTDEEDKSGETGSGGSEEGNTGGEETDGAAEEGQSEAADEEASISDDGKTTGDGSSIEQPDSGPDTTDEVGVDGFAPGDDFTNPMMDDPEENTVLAINDSPTETVDTNLLTDNDAPEIPQEPPVETQPVIEPEPEPAINLNGKLMGIQSGTHYEGEYVLPRSTDPHRAGFYGRIEAGRYEYEYFRTDSGVYLRGSAEEETSINDTWTWTMYDYLPDGILLIETGGEGEFNPEVTEDTWTQTDIGLISAPPDGYFLRHGTSFEASMITGTGSFTGEILGVSADLWSATPSIPHAVSFSGEYAPLDSPLYLFKSPLSGAFPDGGTYSGFLSGKADNATGFINALYINPDGTELGILRSDFSGAFDTTGGWSAAGTIYPIVFSTDPGTITNDNFLANIEEGFLEVERLAGSFSGATEPGIKAHGMGNTSFISGNDWGIFDLMFAYGKYDETAVAGTWTGSVAGFGEFGEDGGMWFAEITEGEWGANGIAGALNGEFLTMTTRGTIEGALIGPAGSAGEWAAVSQGTWQKTDDLQFSSSLDGSLYFVRAEEGGSYWNSANQSNYSYHYDLYTHEGGYQFYNEANGTDTYMQINAWDFDGEIADFYRQEWVYNHDTLAFINYTSASAAGFVLQSLRADPAAYTGLTWENHDQWTGYNMFNTGWFEGVLGGLESPWAATSANQADISLLGFYEAPFYVDADQPIIFAIDMESGYSNSGAYSGYLGGVLGSSARGNLYAMYIDPGNNAGVLIGGFNGSTDRISGLWEADGGVYPVQLYSGIGVTPDTLISGIIPKEYHFWDNSMGAASPGDEGGFYDATGAEIGYLEIGGGKFFNKNIGGQPWGVWQNVTGGAYTGTTGSNWAMNIHHEMWDETGNVSGFIAKYGVSGGTWSGNDIAADVAGAWVDLSDAVVGMSSGKVAGTYDPTEMTWQTAGAGVWLTAEQFLEMAATESGRATLSGLNIPAIEIGRTTLSGSGSTVSVTMTDVTFFAASTGGSPRVWATDNISGTFSVTPHAGDYVYMANMDNSVTADFTLRKWDNNNWAADISNGSGTINRTDIAGNVNVEFGGVAGGTYTGETSGGFSGEGAGVAR